MNNITYKIAILYYNRITSDDKTNTIQTIIDKLFPQQNIDVKILNIIHYNVSLLLEQYDFLIYSNQEKRLIFKNESIDKYKDKLFSINYNFLELKELPRQIKEKVWTDLQTIRDQILIQIENKQSSSIQDINEIILKDGQKIPIKNKEASHEKVLTPDEFLSMVSLLKQLGIEVLTSTKIK